MRRVDDGWSVRTDHGSESDLAEHTIVVAPPFPSLIDSAWRSSATADFQGWVEAEILGEVEPFLGSWRYDLILGRDRSESGSRELFVWPDDPDRLTVTELLSAPHLAILPERPDYTGVPDAVLPLARELWSQVDRADAIYRLSLVHRAHDAVSILRRGTDPSIASRLPREAGDALRLKAKQLRAQVIGAGWRLTGFADALLWPIHASSGGDVDTDFVCDVALDLMRRAQAVALPPAPDLAEWERRLIELESLRGGRGSQ